MLEGTGGVRTGPLLIGYDGTRAAEHALREAAGLLAHRRALVIVVIKPGLAFELIELPASSVGLPPAPIDIRTALEVERKLSEVAREGAQRAAALARELGLEAAPLVVAEEPDVSVAETLLRVAGAARRARDRPRRARARADPRRYVAQRPVRREVPRRRRARAGGRGRG
jgi:hypothetical protein